MQLTPNLKLKKPEASDAVNIEDLNANADVLDAEVSGLTVSLSNKVDKVSGKDLSTNDYTTVEKTKLAGIAMGAQANPGVATTSAAGLMSASDKSKLDGIAAGANNYAHPATHPPSVITQDASNRFVTDAEKSAWNAKAGTTVATTSANGLMSAADKTAMNAATNAATASTLVKRDAAGRMKAAAPIAADDVVRKAEIEAPPYAVTTGTGTSYVGPFVPAITALTAGLRITIKAHVANTGASTIDVNGLGAKSIRKNTGAVLSAGNIKAGAVYTLVYDGTYFFVVEGERGEYGTASAKDVLAGMTIGTEEGIVTGTLPSYNYMEMAQGYWTNGSGTLSFKMPAGAYVTGGAFGLGFVAPTGYDPNFISSNIRSGTVIFGVTGSLNEGLRHHYINISESYGQNIPGHNTTATIFSKNITSIPFKPLIAIISGAMYVGGNGGRYFTVYASNISVYPSMPTNYINGSGTISDPYGNINHVGCRFINYTDSSVTLELYVTNTQSTSASMGFSGSGLNVLIMG